MLSTTAGHRERPRAGWLRRPPIASGARVAHYASLILALPLLLVITRNQWFWFDEWDFLTRGFAGNALNLLVPHHEHWSTIPILIYRGLFDVFGVRSYEPYIGALLIAHIAVAHLLWRLMLWTDVAPWVATTMSALFLVLGAGYENIVWAFQIGFVGSLALGLWAVLIVDHNRTGARGGTVLSWALLAGSLMCSDIGVTMVAIAALTALFARSLRAALVTLSVPVAVYLVWFIAFGRQAIGPGVLSVQTLEALPGFIWSGMTATLGGVAGVAGVGAIAVIGLIVWLIWHRHETVRHPAAFACAFGAVVYFVIAGTGRAASSFGEAGAPRHVYDAAALLIPMVAWMLSELARRDLLAQLAVAAVVLFSAGLGLSQLESHTREGLVNGVERFPPGQSKRQILAAAALLESGLHPIATAPDPAGAPLLSVTELEALARDGDLPSTAGLSAADMLSARAALETSLTASPLFAIDSAHVQSTAGALVTTLANGCSQLQPLSGTPLGVRLTTTTPASLSLQAPVSLELQYFLQVGGDAGVTANMLPLYLRAGHTTYLNVDVDNATPYILTAGSPLVVCAIATPAP